MIRNCLKTIIILLYPLRLPLIPPTYQPRTLALPTPAQAAFILLQVHVLPTTTQNAPSVGVRVANGHPEQSVACATLALVPSLSSSAMQGHVMPSFTHTLIGLGPFTNLGCKIILTKTAVTAYYPDGHPILAG